MLHESRDRICPAELQPVFNPSLLALARAAFRVALSAEYNPVESTRARFIHGAKHRLATQEVNLRGYVEDRRGIDAGGYPEPDVRGWRNFGRLVKSSQSRCGVASIMAKSSSRHSSGTSPSAQSPRLKQNTRWRSSAFSAARFHDNGCRNVLAEHLWRCEPCFMFRTRNGV